jgi:hypothetical protein
MQIPIQMTNAFIFIVNEIQDHLAIIEDLLIFQVNFAIFCRYSIKGYLYLYYIVNNTY